MAKRIQDISEKKKNIARNIAKLREVYHESQLELAAAIGAESSGTIGNYESLIRMPSLDTLEKIAQHYSVSTQQLIYDDFSNFSLDKLPLNDRTVAQQLFLTQFPLICSDKALEDDYFRCAYNAHKELYQLLLSQSKDIPEEIWGDILMYNDSILNKKTPESGANYACYLLFLSLLSSNERLFEGIEAYQKQQVSGKDLLKKYFLQDVPNTDSQKDDANTEELKEFYEEIMMALKVAKHSPSCRDLADFFTALMYMHGMVYNGKRKAFNQDIGNEMMLAFKRLGNKYARSFVKNYFN